MRFPNAVSARDYNPLRYDEGKHLAEKLLFSAPEYLILETRFGAWLVEQLLNMLDRLNEILVKNIPLNTGGRSYKYTRNLSVWLSRLLSWLSSIVEVKS